MDMQQGASQSSLSYFQCFPIELAGNEVWVRPCPRCKATIEKAGPLDSWKCIDCGWE